MSSDILLAFTHRYGFNAGLTAPGNLSKGYDSMSQDFPTIVWRLKELGFNAIRLPYSFSHFQVRTTSSLLYGSCTFPSLPLLLACVVIWICQ